MVIIANKVGAGARPFKDYCLLYYAGLMPEIEDGDTFRCTLKLEKSNEAGNHGNQPLNEKQLEVLAFCKTPKSAAEILAHHKLSNQTKNRRIYITELIESGALVMTIPDKPNDMHQKFFSVDE